MINTKETQSWEHPVPAPGRILPDGELERILKSPDNHAQLRADLETIQESERFAMIHGRGGVIGSLALSSEAIG